MGGIVHNRMLIKGKKAESDQIEDRVQEDPDDIDEVPVETDILKRDMALGSEGPLGNLKEEAPENQQHADTNVRTMKSRQGKEGGAVDTPFVEPESLMIELCPFDALESHERGAHQSCEKHPAGSGLPFLHGHLGKVINKGTTDQNDRVDARQELGHRRKFDSITEIRWPGSSPLSKHEICRNQSAEKKGLRAKEDAHAELTDRRRSGRSGMMIMIGNLRNHRRMKEGGGVVGSIVHLEKFNKPRQARVVSS